MTEDLMDIRSEFENELFNSVLPFWQKYSIDRLNGGYFNCLDKEGNVFDTTKYMWLHGRQIWMFSKLYNTVSREAAWLKIAEHGMEFMQKYAVMENGRVFFSLSENGKPVYLQRKIFTECFYTMALAEYGKAIESEELLAESKKMFEKVWELSRNPALIGRPQFKGEAPLQRLAIPMILLNVMEEIYGNNTEPVHEKISSCVERIRMHFVNGFVYENVLKGGGLHNSSAGRLLNPGHAIEAGWFLKHWGIILNDPSISDLGSEMIRNSFKAGWDKNHGGLFYFIDAESKPPLQLEWNMKLWWPHCEAMYAFLLLYSETKSKKDWEQFLEVKVYCFEHFTDQLNGEWFGYLNRDGSVSSSLKGGPYKGCFHVPRTLLFCLQKLDALI